MTVAQTEHRKDRHNLWFHDSKEPMPNAFFFFKADTTNLFKNSNSLMGMEATND